MKILFFCIFISINLYSCKKKELQFTIKGTVSDMTFGGGHTGAVLKIEEIGTDGNSKGQIAESIISSDGVYELTFKRNSSLKYKLTIEKSKYFTIAEDISFSEFSTEEPLTKNYSSTAKSWVKLRFNNASPSASSDVLTYTKQLGKQDCEECCSKSKQEIIGLGEKVVYCVNDGNTDYSYVYSSVNPTAIFVLKSIYTPAFDTVELILNY